MPNEPINKSYSCWSIKIDFNYEMQDVIDILFTPPEYIIWN